MCFTKNKTHEILPWKRKNLTMISNRNHSMKVYVLVCEVNFLEDLDVFSSQAIEYKFDEEIVWRKKIKRKAKQISLEWIGTLMLHHLSQMDDLLQQVLKYDLHCLFEPKDLRIQNLHFKGNFNCLTPSNWTRNSVFNRRIASCSDSLRSVSKESTSSEKKTNFYCKNSIWNWNMQTNENNRRL